MLVIFLFELLEILHVYIIMVIFINDKIFNNICFKEYLVFSYLIIKRILNKFNIFYYISLIIAIITPLYI